MKNRNCLRKVCLFTEINMIYMRLKLFWSILIFFSSIFLSRAILLWLTENAIFFGTKVKIGIKKVLYSSSYIFLRFCVSSLAFSYKSRFFRVILAQDQLKSSFFFLELKSLCSTWGVFPGKLVQILLKTSDISWEKSVSHRRFI